MPFRQLTQTECLTVRISMSRLYSVRIQLPRFHPSSSEPTAVRTYEKSYTNHCEGGHSLSCGLPADSSVAKVMYKVMCYVSRFEEYVTVTPTDYGRSNFPSRAQCTKRSSHSPLMDSEDPWNSDRGSDLASDYVMLRTVQYSLPSNCVENGPLTGPSYATVTSRKDGCNLGTDCGSQLEMLKRSAGNGVVCQTCGPSLRSCSDAVCNVG